MNKLAEYRKEKRLTQKELADAVGISLSSIGMYEIGQRTPSLHTAKKIADVLGAKIEDIFFLDTASKGKEAVQ